MLHIHKSHILKYCSKSGRQHLTIYDKGSSISLSRTYHSGLIYDISQQYSKHLMIHILYCIRFFLKYDDIWKSGGAQHLIEHKT